MVTCTAGGCHVMERRWSTGEELILLITNAHAAWIIHVQTLTADATVTRMTRHGERTAASSKTNPSCQWNNWGLEMPIIMVTRDTTHLESSSVWTHLKLTYKKVDCNYTLAFCRLGWRTALKQLAVCTIALCSSLFANVIDETILIWSENHPNFDISQFGSSSRVKNFDCICDLLGLWQHKI